MMIRLPTARLSRCVVMLLLLMALSPFSACALLRVSAPQPPVVSIERVRPLNFNPDSQKIALKLRVDNPNPFEMPVRQVDVDARIAGNPFATGRSSRSVTIPAEGSATLDLEVDAAFTDLFAWLAALMESGDAALDYEISGNVSLRNWPEAIPISTTGTIENPLK